MHLLNTCCSPCQMSLLQPLEFGPGGNSENSYDSAGRRWPGSQVVRGSGELFCVDGLWIYLLIDSLVENWAGGVGK